MLSFLWTEKSRALQGMKEIRCCSQKQKEQNEQKTFETIVFKGIFLLRRQTLLGLRCLIFCGSILDVCVLNYAFLNGILTAFCRLFIMNCS